MALTPSSGWSKYSDITVGSPSSDYQMKIDLRRGGSHLDNDPANGILYDENNCYYSDMRDVQINSTDDPTTGTRLPQWTEEVDSGTKRIFWVKTNGAEHIYIFVGNQNASEYSDGEATFDFFDDFNDGTIDSNKWNIKKNSGTVEETGGTLHVKAVNSWEHCGIYTKNPFDEDNKIVEIDIKVTGEGRQSNEIFYQVPGSEIDCIALLRAASTNLLRLYTRQSGNWALRYESTNTINLNQWYHLKIITTGTQVKVYIYDGKSSTSNEIENSGWINYDTFSGNHFFLGEGTTNDEGNFDALFVRKYASSEPSFTNFGAWTDVGGGYVDSGIRYYDGTAVQAISMCSDATTSALRFYDGTNVKHIPLVDINDANASPIRVYDGTEVKALRKQ